MRRHEAHRIVQVAAHFAVEQLEIVEASRRCLRVLSELIDQLDGALAELRRRACKAIGERLLEVVDHGDNRRRVRDVL